MITRRGLVLTLAVLPLATRSGLAQNVTDGSPEALLRFIYGHYVGKSRTAKTFSWNSKPLVDALFEPVLARAVVQDAPTGEVGRLDFDPFVDAQDFEIRDYKLSAESASAERASMLVSFRNLKEPKRVRYDLVRAPQGWRIRDIRWGPGRPGLRKLLSLG